MRGFVFSAVAGAAIAVSGVPVGASGSVDSAASFAGRLLNAHNVERDRAQVPRLRWSRELARDADAWAQSLARKGRLEHARADQRRTMGENLWMGSAGYYSAEDMIGGFLAERAHFRPGAFPQVSRTGNWADVGHYTQVIWPSTQEIGCAVARGGQHDFLVCRYYPAGNMIGQTVG
ncbi:SCP-like extracellular [Altererythrobacter aerius]|uniref:SCP-like extracellular n=1 Tax=Tsuneonella aeria TaxID=1837929 RepID=A0A6I4T8Z1_9SPHN|nr:CAP domain-containing protein [Tsuneonella aeria]MXO73791.1 SCP-like extracellular [Tsuneonella aeria]